LKNYPAGVITRALLVLFSGIGLCLGQTGTDKLANSREHARQKTCLSIAKVVHEKGERKETACGFFIDGKGTLATVLGMAGEPGKLSVVYGEREFSPKLLTYDKYTRLALLKIDGIEAPAVKMGRSAGLEVGDYVFAVNLSKENGKDCVTGRIAGREKDFMGRTLAASLIRLNLMAGPESFGAPLVSTGGSVLGVVLEGMNDEKVNFCYALPAELIQKVQRDFDRHGKVSDCWIGFGMEAGTTTPEIRQLTPDSPAEKSGLKEGDIIQAIGDRKVRDYQDVVDACYYLTHGDEVVFKVLRGLEDVNLRLTPAEKPVQIPVEDSEDSEGE